MRVLEGKLVDGGSIKVAIVVARFNEFITSKLLGGALDTLARHGVSDDDISVAWVPGAFEIPVAAKKLAESTDYDAVICVGAVINDLAAVTESDRGSAGQKQPVSERHVSADRRALSFGELLGILLMGYFLRSALQQSTFAALKDLA
mgnify:CR=1 FL=1